MEQYEKIASLKAELHYIESHKEFLESLKKECIELEKQKQEHEQRLYKENKDVENLEKTTIVSLFHSIIGNKEDCLEKERQEAMQASIDYHHIINEYQLKKEEVEKLQKRIQQEHQIKQQLQQLQLEFIQITNPQQAKQIQQFLTEYEELQKFSKEMTEAIQAGLELTNSLEKVISELGSAKGWGIYDMVGGGLISTAIKHQHMDKAQRYYETVKMKIKSFEKELKDVNDLSIEYNKLGTTLLTFDYIFDSLFVDWLVQSKISKNKHNMEKLYNQVSQIIHSLQQKESDIKRDIQDKHQNIQNILESI